MEVESTFRDMLVDLFKIRHNEITSPADERILDLIEVILNRLILLNVEK